MESSFGDIYIYYWQNITWYPIFLLDDIAAIVIEVINDNFMDQENGMQEFIKFWEYYMKYNVTKIVIYSLNIASFK